MRLYHLVIAVVVISSLCVVPPLALLLSRIWNALSSRRLERLVRRHRHLLQSLATPTGSPSDETLASLGRLADPRLVEQLIDRAADMAKRPVSDFRDTYDAAGVTRRYRSILEKSRSWKRRAFAAEKLGHIGSATALPALLAIIRDVRNEDEDVRGAALRALGRIRDARAVPILIEALDCPETWLPPRIGEILVSIGEPAVPFLEAELRRSPSEHTRMWVAEILGWLEAKSAAPILIEALSDINPEVRARAAAALGKIKDDRAVHRLLELLISDPVPFVRVKVSQALGRIGHPAVIDYLITTLKDPEWWVRVRAVEALEKLGEKAVAALLPALEDEDGEVRKRAAMALERIGYVDTLLDEYALPPFKRDLRRILLLVARAGIIESLSQRLATTEGTFRKRIVRLFGEARVGEAAGPLLELLVETDDWSLKARIIESLGKIGAKEAVPRLIEYLKDEEGWVRRSAVEALGRLEAQDVADDIALILDDPSPLARESALEALLQLGLAGYRDRIVRLLADPTPRVRQTTIKVLRELDLPLTEDVAAALLTDTSHEVQGEAIRYFAHRRDAGRAGEIIRLLQHGAPALATAIVEYFTAVRTADFRDVCAALKLPDLEPPAIASLIEIASFIKGEDAHRFIAGYAQSVDSSLRERAFTALARFGVEEHEEIFARALLDPAARVRIAVLTGIAANPRHDLVRRAQILADDPDQDVRTAVALVIGSAGAAEFAPQAERLLNDPSAKVKAGALIALAAFGDPSLLGTIHAHWKAPDVRAAITAVKHDPLFAPVLDLITGKAKQSNNLEVGFILTDDERAFTRDIIERIRESHDAAVRLQAMEILTMLPAEEFLTSVLGIMKSDPLAELRVQAMEIVSTTAREEDAVSAVSSMLVDPSTAVRTRAAEILGRHGTPSALEALLHVLDTSDRKFRETVTTSLSAIVAGNLERFGELLRSIPETKTRKIGMAWLVGKTRKRGSMRFLVNLLADRDPDVRASAVGALAKFRRRPLLGHFAKLIYDPSERVRAAAVNAIGAVGDDTARALCEKALEDIDEYVRRRAVVALAKIDGEAAVSLLLGKAAAAPEFRSYARGLLYATGASSSPSVSRDPLAKGIVAELCPEEEMRAIFRTSADRKKRLHAFRILSLIGAADDEELMTLARKDPSAEIREEALLHEEQ
jgi:HEAT repeat protein